MLEYSGEKLNVFQGLSPKSLIKRYGSPLYVYNEKIIRENCRKMKSLVSYHNFNVHYSAKANSNLAILQIIRDEGLMVDAMSPGEIFAEMEVGFTPKQILYVANNVKKEDMLYAIERGILMSIDSISQLEQYGELNPGSKVALRFNPGVGDGHNKKTITAGKGTKFGIEISIENIVQIREICKKFHIKIVGVHMHIGSLFTNSAVFIESVKIICGVSRNFDDLDFIDLGGGFGVPYRKQEGEEGLNLPKLREDLDQLLYAFARIYGKDIEFKIEPGRFIVAESSAILGTVTSIKRNYGIKFVGTDIGFNAFLRPAMYDAHHDIEIFSQSKGPKLVEKVHIVGNICENSDNLGENRMIPQTKEGNIVAVMDTGAYGHVMSSNYNNMLRPAQVLIRHNSQPVLIRERDRIEDLISKDIPIEL
ncbi:MAG: diaminopimelate decarboxylase [Defluviitaleaceae bacterium]|nr:diaminopimelate decarboxylase [Defluviitaleaceae bacterium]